MGTHYKGNEKEVGALDAYIKLMRAAGSVMARVNRHLAGSDLTISQFGVLEALFHLGPLSQRELGRRLLKSGGNMTLVIDNLEKRGLVRRERAQEDRRFVTVLLTEKGTRLIADILPLHVRQIVLQMGVLSSEEQRELERLCKLLGLGRGGDR